MKYEKVAKNPETGGCVNILFAKLNTFSYYECITIIIKKVQ